MNNIILKEDFDSMCIDIYDLLHEFNTYDLNYDEIKEVLIENEFNEYEIMLLLQLYEGAFWDKIKSGARNIKDKAVNVKDKVKSVASNVADKARRVKDHVKRHKYAYGLAAAALTGGAGLAYVPLAAGAGHFFDKHG